MPPRIPQTMAAAIPSRCSDFAVNTLTQRFAAASLSTTARLAVPRYPTGSSGASVLGLDGPAPASDARSFRAPPSQSPDQNQPTPRRGNANSAALSRVLFNSEVRHRMGNHKEENMRSAIERMRERKVSDDYLKQMTRRWRVGEVYAPNDLSAHEANAWKQPRLINADVVDILGINPIEEYRNFSMISEYVTMMGQIRHGRETGLRPKNQRRMAKAIRRAIGMGIHPSVHKHPEIMAQDMASTLWGSGSGGNAGKPRR